MTAEIHLLAGIFKYPHTNDLVSQIIGVTFGVVLRDAKQHQQTLLDLPDGCAVDLHRRSRYSLDDSSHSAISPRPQRDAGKHNPIRGSFHCKKSGPRERERLAV